MRIDGIQLVEGSNVSNLTVSSGTSFPALANIGEMFFETSSEPALQGLYLYTGVVWTRLSTERQLVSPSGPTLPSNNISVPGQVFFLNSNDAAEGLYFYDVDLGWRASSTSSSGVSTTVIGDILGTITPGADSTLTLPNIVLPGIYKSVNVNSKGQITSGTNPTTLAGYGITDAAQADADLTAISNLTGTGLARRTGADTWVLDSSAYLTSNQLVTVQGDATGSGSTTITLTLSNVNSTIGTVGSATTIPILTVNAKGLVTGTSSAALSSTNVPEGTNLYFTSARANAASPVQSVAGRTGAVSLSVSDISGAAPLASPTFTGTVSGITKSMVGLANVDNTSDLSKPISTAEQTALNLKANSASPTFTGTVSGITKSMVGLANVDNTSDLSKPISNATSAAIAALTTTNIAEGTNLYYTSSRAISSVSAANATVSGTWSFNNPITSAEPTAAAHLATKQYVDNITTGLDFKASVKVASTANILLSGTQVIDGISLIVGDRVLVKDQTDGTQNGIYSVSSGAWTRTFDADNTPGTEVTAGMYCFIEQGTYSADTGWVLTTTGTVVLGTTILSFAQFTGLGQVSTGPGLTKAGSVLSLSSTGTAGTYTSVTTDAYGRVVSGGQASTSNITEGTNLYFTSTRAQSAISASGSGISYSPGTGVIASNGTALNTPNTLVFRDASGNFSAGVITASLVGNANTASILNTARLISASGDGTWSVNFDGSAAVSSAFTLATVNATTGTFGSSTAIPIFTVNAKGLITSASSAALSTTNITEGTNLYFTNARGAASAPVQSVAGRTGAVSLSVSDISGAAPLASPTFTGTVSGITKSMVGLANVDNTADLSKPISTAQQTAFDLKANIASPTFTGTVSGITKSMVGLSNVDNTSDLSKPISTAEQTALNLKANIASPTFTGQVTIPEGSSAVPGLTFANDGAPDTGLYHISDGVFGITNNSIPTMRISPAGVQLLATPTAPTPAALDNSTNIATTEFVKAQGYITSEGAPVQSVAGRTGAVVLTIADVSGIVDGGSF
jgi:hypothetical protein